MIIPKTDVPVSFGQWRRLQASRQLLDAYADRMAVWDDQKKKLMWLGILGTALYQERVKAGLDMPSDVFSLWIKDKTKISRKK